MKKQILNILHRLLYMILVLLGFVLMGTGCNKEPKVNNDGLILTLDEIPVIVQYEQLSLIEIKWKLIGFANATENTIKIAEPQNENCYTLIFNTDGTFNGQTSTNSKVGRYEVNMQENGLKILNSVGTEINELYDGKLYVESMFKVESFLITEKGLALYYNNKTRFLLFKPVTL